VNLIVLKSLLPSLREKKRYVVFEIESKRPVSFSSIRIAIERSLISFLGEFGLAKAGVIFPSDFKSQRGILRVSHTSVHLVRAALSLIANINKEPVIVKTIYTSGVLLRARRYVR